MTIDDDLSLSTRVWGLLLLGHHEKGSPLNTEEIEEKTKEVARLVI